MRSILVTREIPEPIEPFETWLLRCVALAVDAGEIPADLLAKLQAEIELARDRPQAESHADAVLIGRNYFRREDTPETLDSKPFQIVLPAWMGFLWTTTRGFR